MTFDIRMPDDVEITRAARRARSIINETCGGRGMHRIPADVLALMILVEPVGHTVTSVAERLGLPIATAVDLVDRAEDTGLITRVKMTAPAPRRNIANPTGFDARETIITLTSKGRQARKQRRGSKDDDT